MKSRRPILPAFNLMMVVCAVSALIPSVLTAQSRVRRQPVFSQDRVLVSFHSGTSASAMRSAHGSTGGTVIKTISAIGVEVVAVPSGRALEAIRQYRLNPDVKFAEPNYQRPLFRPVTNEGSEPTLGIANNFTEQWGLHNEGQSFGATIDPLWGTLIFPAYTGAADADIDAPEGWNFTIGSPDIKIAILDSGVSCEHVDLDSKCLEQVNFVSGHGSPANDIIGHGTHVAAIAAAETNNGIGTAGVAQLSTIGSLKVCYEDYTLELFGIIQGVCEDADVAAAIVYAADNGYHVINLSLAGPEPSAALQSAVNYAWEKGVVIVAAAGNDYGSNRLYPAACENVISVAATDYYDNLAYFSNFSMDADDWVSVAAPGHTILSAVPGDQCNVAANDPVGCYDWKTGTSMSAPFVSGIAALLWSYMPAPSNAQIRSIIENSADKAGALGQNFLAWTKNGRVNLYKALLTAREVTGNIPVPGDYDGDVRSDFAVWKSGDGQWRINPSSDPGTLITATWGLASDLPVPADYDGDGASDIAVWRPGNGFWYILSSSDPGAYVSIQWGLTSDIPTPGDYDGDGKADIAVWRPSNGVWYIRPSGDRGSYVSIQWGLSSDIPTRGDYDGDGKTDIAVWRPGNGVWYILSSKNPGSYKAQVWGLAGDKPVSGDFDGDGMSDIALWRPGDGHWYILPSGNPGTFINIAWGLTSDMPVPADYNGDGKTEIAIYRPGNSVWYIRPEGDPVN